ncbi:MAG TPA: efflux RND transporter periplasmic adaptor subunit [Gemmatimonadales bacterium]|nr:efflux RND transporter periplasmic adaptor subunit [Gemmatimonadales bacterium]
MSFTTAGSIPPRRRPRILGALLFTLPIVAALVAAMLLGRRSSPPSPEGHDHANAKPTAALPQPVHLAPDAARRIGVTFAQVTFGPIDREIRTVGQVTYDETRVSVVAPKVEGWIERLHVNATGQPVRRGQPLFEIYSPMVLTAEQELLLAKGLARRLGGGAEEARDDAATLADAARRRLLAWDVPKAQIDAVERSGEVGRTVTLLAPVSGVVLEKPVLQGQRIMPGEPVYRIADLSRIWLEGEVFERDLAAARVGQPVRAEFAALPGTVRSGRIAYISPTLDPTTRTARIRIELSNPAQVLKPGMFGTIRFTPASTPAMTVPRSAVLVTGERALAFVKRADGAFEPRIVTVGRATDERLEILHGLALGDTVVASATFLVDAESNLGTSLGGMGDMPGMDIRQPTVGPQPHSPPAKRTGEGR